MARKPEGPKKVHIPNIVIPENTLVGMRALVGIEYDSLSQAFTEACAKLIHHHLVHGKKRKKPQIQRGPNWAQKGK